MEIERETVVQIAVSTVSVLAFIGILVWVGVTFNHGGLGQDGGIALVGAIVAFVLGMAGVGFWLAYTEN